MLGADVCKTRGDAVLAGIVTCTETPLRDHFWTTFEITLARNSAGRPMCLKPEAPPLPGGPRDLHRDPSKGSLLDHILNHTGSEQCWATDVSKTRGAPPTGWSPGPARRLLQGITFGPHSKSQWLGTILGVRCVLNPSRPPFQVVPGTCTETPPRDHFWTTF